MGSDASLALLIVRHLRHGLRESLSIAGQIGTSVEAVHAALHELQAACGGCLEWRRPYASEARIVIQVVDWNALTRVAGISAKSWEKAGGVEGR